MTKNAHIKDLKVMVVDALKRLNISEEHAGIVADVLIEADLRGLESHGVARLDIYAQRIKAGLINTKPQIKIVNESAGMALVDGDNGMGQVTAKYAMDKCIEKAKTNGISIVGIRNTNHFGIGAYYAMMALKHGLIGFASTNASPLMAPFGGSQAMLGTNPFSVAVPAGKQAPIVLDMATSLVARGKLRLPKEKVKDPIDWALDKDGNPTDDPATALKGTLLPVGGPKGYGMAVLVDIMAGLLTGAAFGPNIGSLFGDFTKPQNTGNVLMAIDVEKFMPRTEFESRMDEYILNIKNSKPAKGFKEIFLPGEIEHNKTLERRQNGIPLSPQVQAQLEKLLLSLGLSIGDYLK